LCPDLLCPDDGEGHERHSETDRESATHALKTTPAKP
jgi:hypothetical protein